MACSKPLPVDMRCQTHFEKYTFSYKWVISDIRERINHDAGGIQTPNFSLKDETQVSLQLYCHYMVSREYYAAICINPVTQPSNTTWADLTCAIIGSNGEEKCSKTLRNITIDTSNMPSVAFVRQVELTKERSEYLVDGALNLDCKITISQWSNPLSNADPIPRITAPQFSLPSKLEKARKEGKFTDVTLVAKGKEFKVHRNVLVVHSSVLCTRFEERWNQDGNNKVDMSDMDPDVTDAMLTFLYTGDVKVIEKYAHEMLQAADKYDIKDLKAVCEELISHSLTVENSIHSLVLADTHNAPALKKICIEFICSNKQVMKSEGWKELKRSERNASLVMDINEALLNLLKI